MTLDPDLLELMPHTVKIAPKSGQDAYAKPTYGADVSWQARVEGKIQLVRDNEGIERVSSTTIYLAGVSGADIRARVTLPDGTTPPILSINTQPDETGDLYDVIMLE